MIMTINDTMYAKIEDTARALMSSSYGTAISGAGMSAESGVPTFRGPDGLWTKYGEPDDLGYEKFEQDPKLWWETRLSSTYMPEMKKALDGAKPNDGHLALAKLEEMGHINCVITQNVDGLHSEAGTENIVEIHGNNRLLRCIQCENRYTPENIPMEVLPPICPDCNGLIKIDTVMFGEPIPRSVLLKCQNESSQTDCMLILGTSGVVYPAAALPSIAKSSNGATLIEINPEPSALSPICDIVIQAPTGVALPALVELLEMEDSSS
jgi:NAD-dependent deacetylase